MSNLAYLVGPDGEASWIHSHATSLLGGLQVWVSTLLHVGAIERSARVSARSDVEVGAQYDAPNLSQKMASNRPAQDCRFSASRWV
jgi:hypothetical protein